MPESPSAEYTGTGQTMKKDCFKQHQYAFTAHIRDPENNPVPENIEHRRMAIYTELLYNNIEGFISGAFPVIREIYNDADWHKMVRDFFSTHQSQSPYFLHIAEEFIDYLNNERSPQPEDPPGLQDLAHYEWVELALHVSDETIDMHGIDANGDLLEGIPVFSPLAWPLVYDYPVHLMGPDNIPPQIDANTEVVPTCLVVYRNRNDEVRFLNINPVTARLISLLESDETLTGKQALQAITNELDGQFTAGVIMQGGIAALEQLREHGIILGAKRQPNLPD